MNLLKQSLIQINLHKEKLQDKTIQILQKQENCNAGINLFRADNIKNEKSNTKQLIIIEQIKKLACSFSTKMNDWLHEAQCRFHEKIRNS